jgi:transglutaminase-like putative cysteine protease
VTPNLRMTLTTAIACVLASTVLYPVFTDSLWFAAATGGVAVVAAVGALTRLRPLPVLLCLAAGLAGLLLYLNLVFEARASLLRVIPTARSLSRLWDLVGTGFHESNRYAPPVPHLPGLLLLATAGVGITAIAADLIAVRLRSTALAGLPLLVLFTVPVTLNAPHGQLTTAVVFCLGCGGYLAMLSADGRERIRVWGRLVSLWRTGPRHVADTRALAAAGRRVGLASIVLALCAPLLVPGLHPSKLFSSGPGIGGKGGGTGGSLVLPTALAQTVNDLHESRPVTVFTYTSDAPDTLQEADAEYFRQYVFDTLADTGWQVTNYASGATPVASLPGPQGLTDITSSQLVNTTVTMGPDIAGPGAAPVFLPVPYPPTSIAVPGKWLADPELMVYSTSSPAAGRRYTVASLAVDPSQAQLSAVPALPRTASLAPEVDLPSGYQTQALKQLATEHAAGQTTEFGKVDALANWLAGGGFSYSLATAPFDNAAGLLAFLTRTRSGFCVQYAYAMTVLTRLLGIPARFVVGYTGGTRAKDGVYTVKNTDAHAWTEVYFPTLGWIRFEPTPGGQGTANPPSYMNSATGQGQLNTDPIIKASGGTGAQPAASKPTGPNSKLNPEGFGAAAGGSLAARHAGTPWAAVVLAVIAALVLACALVALLAPSARQAMTPRPGAVARRRRPATTPAILLAIATALVALALYRLLARTSGLNITAGWATVGVAAAITAAVVLVTPAAGRLARRRWRWFRAADDTDRAHAAWEEFRDDLTDYGVTSRPSEPPRTLAARVTATVDPQTAQAITRIALAEERASYAARPADASDLYRDTATARHGLATQARRGTRWRAALLPASMLAALAETAVRIPDRVSALHPRHWRSRAAG